jgi:hypothetical protein
MARRRAPKTVDELLAQARATLPGRPAPPGPSAPRLVALC